MIEVEEATRCVIVVSANLSPGHAANAAAVIALTIGKLHPHLTGAEWSRCRQSGVAVGTRGNPHACPEATREMSLISKTRHGGNTCPRLAAPDEIEHGSDTCLALIDMRRHAARFST